MRCQYCHNPETWFLRKHGTWRTAEDVLQEALRYKSYWKMAAALPSVVVKPYYKSIF